MRPTVLEVNKNNFKNNVNLIKEYTNNCKTLIPVIKADCYGTEINTQIDIINDFEIVAVAICEEGIYLRNIGYKGEILLLNQPYEDDILDIINYDITVGVASFEFLNKLNSVAQEHSKKVNVHIEIETGMNRTGFFIDEIKEMITKIKELSNIKVDGIYSHLSSADIDHEYTLKQVSVFEEAINVVEKVLGKVKYKHIEASTGTIKYNSNLTNAIRPGIILYGFDAIDNQNMKLDLKPIATLKTKITFIKLLGKGERIGYSGSYVLEDERKIATIPIGYADGIPRSLSNNGEVVINGQKAKIVGKICMDSFMVDVTDIEDVKVGDIVYIWDNEIIKLEDVAKNAGTINYEILSRISKRVRREFI